jgi:hypothetical protein
VVLEGESVVNKLVNKFSRFYRRGTSSACCLFHAGSFLVLPCNPEVGGDIFLINVAEELHKFYSSLNMIRMIKSRRMRWVGHGARMEEKRNAYRILVGKPEGKRPLGRPRRRWLDNNKIDLREIGWDGMDWIYVAQDRDQWRALVNTVMNIRVP